MDKNLQELSDNLWTELVKGKVDKKHDFRYPVLGSMSQNGYPEIRTVILRDVLISERKLIFFTDYRSPKVMQLKAQPKASLLFYHYKKKLQLRISGIVTLYNKDSLAKKYLSKLPEIALKDYLSITAPGKKVNNSLNELLTYKKAFENFTVVQIETTKIDYLQLKLEGHERMILTWNNGWDGEKVTP
ncbi:MAG: pyridoxamine 5'-phosphate oxidase family protein [Bacteroidota bacterium]